MFKTSFSLARSALCTVGALATVFGFGTGTLRAAPTAVPISGQISHIVLTTPGDFWSAGTMIVGGQTVTLPRNLLIDLPANRLTLWQLVDQAPAACKALGQTGLAKADSCNTRGKGAIASIAANRTNGGNIIAGDLLIEKGQEVLSGVVTYINHVDGYMRINGTPAAALTPTVDPLTGVMARMNDPISRHTVQSGLGCATGNTANCSADPRFTNDPDNYTNTAITGYPMCLPSRTARTWAGLPEQGTGVDLSPAVAGGAARANAGNNANGDPLCPHTNRTINAGNPINDSRFFAPIQVGDHITVEGNFETVNGVRFVSFHTSTTQALLGTKTSLSQPDYLIPDEVEHDGPGFQNKRARTLLIGYSTLPPDVLFWTIHYDPKTNTRVEKPWATTKGCDTVTKIGNDCGIQTGLVQGTGNNIWKVRYYVDFVDGGRARANPCIHLNADPRMGSGFCPVNGSSEAASIAEQFAILSPMPREIQTRTGHLLAAQAAGIEPTTVDINGKSATNGQYLVPFGINLGGVGLPEFVEIDLTKTASPFPFTGMPWTLDRRLSPNGCNVACESTPQPLDPYPFEGIAMDPRTQTPETPTGPYNDPKFTAAALSDVRNRILSYVTRIGTTEPPVYDFNGDASVLAWPPADPAPFAISATPAVTFCDKGSATGVNSSCVSAVLAPTCTAPLVLQNGACVSKLVTVVPVVSEVQVATTVSPVAPPVVTPLPAVDTVTISRVVWVPVGGLRGLMVVAKTSQPAAPVPSLFVTAFNGAAILLPQTALTRVTAPVATDIGAIPCSVVDPCWQLPATRMPKDVKPTSVVVQSSKNGSATALSNPNALSF